jgi:hypothetical protein
MANDLAELVAEDQDKALLILVAKRLNRLAKAAINGKYADSDVSVVVEKWTDAILWDFAIDAIEGAGDVYATAGTFELPETGIQPGKWPNI